MLYRINLVDENCYIKFLNESVIAINYDIENNFIETKSLNSENIDNRIEMANDISIIQKIDDNDILWVCFNEEIFICKVTSVTKFSDDNILFLIGVDYYNCSKVLDNKILNKFSKSNIELISDKELVEFSQRFYDSLCKVKFEENTNNIKDEETSIEFVRRNSELVPLKKGELMPYKSKKKSLPPDKIRVKNNFGDLIIELYAPRVEEKTITGVPAVIKRYLPANTLWNDYYIKFIKEQMQQNIYSNINYTDYENMLDMSIWNRFFELYK